METAKFKEGFFFVLHIFFDLDSYASYRSLKELTQLSLREPSPSAQRERMLRCQSAPIAEVASANLDSLIPINTFFRTFWIFWAGTTFLISYSFLSIRIYQILNDWKNSWKFRDLTLTHLPMMVLYTLYQFAHLCFVFTPLATFKWSTSPF